MNENFLGALLEQTLKHSGSLTHHVHRFKILGDEDRHFHRVKLRCALRLMYSESLTASLNQFRHRPRARFNASRSCGRHADRAVCFAEVVISEVERDRSLKVFNLLAERVGQAGERAAVHPQSMILLLNVTGRDAGDIGHSSNNGLFHLHHFARAVVRRRFFVQVSPFTFGLCAAATCPEHHASNRGNGVPSVRPT